MNRVLFVIARDRADIVDQMLREFGSPNHDVIPDGRHGQRRQQHEPVVEERREADRRARHIDSELRQLGFAVIVRS